MEDVRIVQCGLADAEELADIGRETFLDTYSADTSPADMREFLREAYRPETIRAELEAPGSRFFIARVGTAVAGYLKLNTGDAQGERLEGVGLEIEAIYVRTRYQGMGIGSLMLAHARATAEATGADHIWLGVWELNRPAIHFYERKGFTEVGWHPFRFGSVEHTDLIPGGRVGLRLELAPHVNCERLQDVVRDARSGRRGAIVSALYRARTTSATPERSTAAALAVRSSARVPAASPADRMASG
jgi:diamine N-acetyltransferase